MMLNDRFTPSVVTTKEKELPAALMAGFSGPLNRRWLRVWAACLLIGLPIVLSAWEAKGGARGDVSTRPQGSATLDPNPEIDGGFGPEEIAALLDAWRVSEAEKALAELTASQSQHRVSARASINLPHSHDDVHGIRSSPRSPEITFLMARLKFLQGAYDEALALLDTAERDSGAGAAEFRSKVERAKDEVSGFQEQTSSDGRFMVRVKPGPDEILVPLALDVLPKIRKDVGEFLGYLPEDRIVVEFFPEVDALSRVTSLTVDELEASGTIAICKYNKLMVTSPRATVRGYPWLDTLAHEYVHLVVTRLSMNRAPIWLQEALARFVEVAVRREGPPRLDAYSESLLAKALAEDKLISFERMSPSMAKLPTQEATTLAFAEVFTAMSYIYEQVGGDGIRNILENLAAGATDRRAIKKVMGVSWGSFKRGWLRHLRASRPQVRTSLRVANVRFRKDGIPEEQRELDDVSEKARDFVRLGLYLEGRGHHLAALKEYGKAEALAKEANPFVRNRMAAALMELDRPAEALDKLQGLDEVFPSYGPTYRNQGYAYMALGKRDKARTALELALTVNPFDPSVHTLLADIYRHVGDKRLAGIEEAALHLLSSISSKD